MPPCHKRSWNARLLGRFRRDGDATLVSRIPMAKPVENAFSQMVDCPARLSGASRGAVKLTTDKAIEKMRRGVKDHNREVAEVSRQIVICPRHGWPQQVVAARRSRLTRVEATSSAAISAAESWADARSLSAAKRALDDTGMAAGRRCRRRPATALRRRRAVTLHG